MALTIANYDNLNTDIADLQNYVKEFSTNIESIQYISNVVRDNWDSGTMGENSTDFHNDIDKCINTLKEINKLLNGYTVTLAECSAELKATAAKIHN